MSHEHHRHAAIDEGGTMTEKQEWTTPEVRTLGVSLDTANAAGSGTDGGVSSSAPG